MRLASLTSLLLLAGIVGCTRESRSPDALRKDTANVTAGAAQDAKAVALGVFDGLRRRGPLNINKAGRDELETLPGITPRLAEAIIAERPYTSGADLLRRHTVTKAEYDRIADRIMAR